jgi:FkbM family methyltransferase
MNSVVIGHCGLGRKAKQIIRHHLARRLGAPEIPVAMERLRHNGFVPEHIFDIGAHSGEFARSCRRVWPIAKLTCFEVLPHRVSELRNWCAQDGNATVKDCLLGAETNDAVPLHEMETASSVLEEHFPPMAQTRSYPMQTVDSIVKSSGEKPPNFLKLDVQGYELEVLRGAQTSLPHASALLIETNLIDIHKGAPLLEDLIGFLNERDFVAYDICGLTRRPLDQALWQADFIFVPKNSHLRSDKRWQL